MTLFIRNIPYSTTEDDIYDLLADIGTPTRVSVILDRETGKPRGFGFADVTEEEGAAAIETLNGTVFGGREVSIEEARPRPERRAR